MRVVLFVSVLLHWQLSSARIPINDHHVISPLMEPCEIRISGGGLGEPQPLILNSGATEFIEPKDANGIIRLNPGDDISLFCTTGFQSPSTTNDIIRATCTTGTIFIIDGNKGNEMTFSNIICKSYPYHTARKSGKTCGNGAGVDIEVGFIVKERFIELFHICHDDIMESTMYVTHSMIPGNEGYQRSFPRPSWLSSGFFGGKNVDNIYTNVRQNARVAEILGSQELADKYIKPTTTSTYLARGHMAAKVDFIFGSQQRATFWLMNVAPQWQSFNAGNWERVESSTRKMASQRNTHFDVYTGTYGVMTLPDINGQHQEIYLYFDENNNGQIPVPKIYYRVLYEKSTKRGIVLIGVNNIHITAEEAEEQNYIICEDVSDKINWINWERNDQILGYSYACEVEEFTKVVENFPKLEISGLYV